MSARRPRAHAAELEREAEPAPERSAGWKDTLADGRNRLAVTAATVARSVSDGRGRLVAAARRWGDSADEAAGTLRLELAIVSLLWVAAVVTGSPVVAVLAFAAALVPGAVWGIVRRRRR